MSNVFIIHINIFMLKYRYRVTICILIIFYWRRIYSTILGFDETIYVEVNRYIFFILVSIIMLFLLKRKYYPNPEGKINKTFLKVLKYPPILRTLTLYLSFMNNYYFLPLKQWDNYLDKFLFYQTLKYYTVLAYQYYLNFNIYKPTLKTLLSYFLFKTIFFLVGIIVLISPIFVDSGFRLTAFIFVSLHYTFTCIIRYWYRLKLKLLEELKQISNEMNLLKTQNDALLDDIKQIDNFDYKSLFHHINDVRFRIKLKSKEMRDLLIKVNKLKEYSELVTQKDFVKLPNTYPFRCHILLRELGTLLPYLAVCEQQEIQYLKKLEFRDQMYTAIEEKFDINSKRLNTILEKLKIFKR